MVHYKLVIGNRNYSSWSLRVWLHLQLSKGDKDTLEVVRIPLYADNYKAKVLEHSPAGRVPILIAKHARDSTNDKAVTVWDSLAIMEFVLTSSSCAIGWPQENPAAHAMARSIACEFHSGFLAIRDELPQNIKRTPAPLACISDSCREQIQRVDEIWTTCYASQSTSGPWLFGPKMTIADIMYIPVALRFWVYGIKVSSTAQKFIDVVLANPLVQEWIRDAKQETERLEFIDQLVPASESPLIL